MEVSDLIKNVFQKTPSIDTSIAPLGGVTAKPMPTKNDTFDPSMLAEAQKTFIQGLSHNQGSPAPSGANEKGTAGNMIPPGWSAQGGSK